MLKILFSVALAGATVAAGAQSDSAAVYLQKATEEKAKGRTMESFKALEKAYGYNKKDTAITREMADALMALRRYPQARLKYQELESMGVANAGLYKSLMDLSFNMRQFDDAIKYAGLVKKYDAAQKVSYIIGKAHYDSENYGEAIKFLNEAMKEDAANAEAPYLIARAYSDMSNFKQAMPHFEKALALDPANNRMMYEIGLMYYANHDDKNSLKYLLMAAEKGYKRDNEYLENLAVAYLNNKQFDDGLKIMKESLQRRPSDVALINTVAEACYDAKKYDEAIGYWDQLLGMDKTNASALYMIGMSYQKKGEKGKGQALCDKAIEMDPSLASKRKKMETPF